MVLGRMSLVSRAKRMVPGSVKRQLLALRGDPRKRLLRMLPRGSVGAEVGVWKGDFSELILRVVRPRELHLIDPWRFEVAPGYSSARYGGSKAKSQADMDAIYSSVTERFGVQVASGRVAVHRSPSADAGGRFEDGFFDWVYIDGNHLYEFVLADLESFYPKVRSGGFLAGDDYGRPGWWDDGVTRAVHVFCQATPDCELVVPGQAQFLIKKP